MTAIYLRPLKKKKKPFCGLIDFFLELSSSLCSFIVSLALSSSSPCSVIVSLALSSSPYSVTVFLSLSSSPCSVVVSLPCRRTPAVSLSVFLLCHRSAPLSSPPCSVIVPLLCHCHPACFVISPCFALVPLFYFRLPALLPPVSLPFHRLPTLSSSSCPVIVPLLFHYSLCHCLCSVTALPTPPSPVLAPLQCHRLPCFFIIPVLVPLHCHRLPALDSLSPCSEIVSLLCPRLTCSVIIPILCLWPLSPSPSEPLCTVIVFLL